DGQHIRKDEVRMEIAKVRQRIERFQLVPRVNPYRQIVFDRLFVLIQTMHKVQVPWYQRVNQEAQDVAVLHPGSAGDTGDALERHGGALRRAHKRSTQRGKVRGATVLPCLQVEQNIS